MPNNEATHPVPSTAEIELLRSAIADGLVSGAARPADEIFDRLESKYQAAQTENRNRASKNVGNLG